MPSDFESAIAEMVANEHLARKYDRFGYLAGSSGEIDFYRATEWALEVKWSPVAENISKLFFKAPVPKKIVWTHRNFLNEWPIGRV